MFCNVTGEKTEFSIEPIDTEELLELTCKLSLLAASGTLRCLVALLEGENLSGGTEGRPALVKVAATAATPSEEAPSFT